MKLDSKLTGRKQKLPSFSRRGSGVVARLSDKKLFPESRESWVRLKQVTGQGKQGTGYGGNDLVFVELVVGAGFEENGSGNVQEITGYQARKDHAQIGVLQLVQNNVVAE